MASTREKLAPFIPAIAGLSSGLGACLIFYFVTGTRVSAPNRGAAAACAAVLLAGLAVPAVSIAFTRFGPDGPAEDIYRWARVAGGTLGGTALGIFIFSLAAARPVILAVIASLVIIDTCAFSFGALARALGRASRKAFGSSEAGRLVAAAALLVLVAAPFWSRGLLGSAAGPWLAKPFIGASPFLATALPWTSASAAWTFDPRVSNVLYRVWVGTDFPVHYPSWISCAVGHFLAGCALFASAELPRAAKHMRPPGANRVI